MIRNITLSMLFLLLSLGLKAQESEASALALKSLNNVSIKAVSLPRFMHIREQYKLQINLKNNGINEVSSIVLNWNDGRDHISTVKTKILSGKTATISHPISISYRDALEKEIRFSVLKVNHEKNTNLFKGTHLKLINFVTKAAGKKVVVEEGTGPWCGACPVGIIAMKKMEETYAHEQFIGISVQHHEMGVEAYSNSFTHWGGIPAADIDRTVKEVYPVFDDLNTHYQARKSLSVPAGMDLTITGTGNTVSIETKATFNTNITNANYRLAVIITEDKIKGSSPSYDQTNYFSGVNNPDAGWFQNEPNPVPASKMEYDRVAKALLGGFSGQPNSVPTTITNGQVVTHTFNYTIPSTSNRDNMHAIVLLIDQSNGQIINAETKKLQNSLSISEEALIGLKVWPNPSQEYFYVSFKLKEDFTISLFDAQGRSVYQKHHNYDNNLNKARVSTTNLTKGTYILTVSRQGTSYHQKVIVK